MKKSAVFAAAAFFMLTGISSSANVAYLKSDETFRWGDKQVWLAAYADSDDVIPLSKGPDEGYTYAYTTEDRSIKSVKISPSEFIDIEEYDLYVKELSARGVLLGNGDGTFSPDKELSRAEMAAIFSRLFSIEPLHGEQIFEDTPLGEWYTPYITALCKKGVFKVDTNFNPNQNVTREQLTAMTHRMLTEMGCMKDNGTAEYSAAYKDVEAISEFAEKAYNDLKTNNYMLICDDESTDPMDSSNDEYRFYPQKAVSRYECAEFLYYVIRDFFRENAPAILRETAPDAQIPILDGSTSTYSITDNIYQLYYQNSNNHESKPKVHSKTSNSYKRLIDGEVEMIFVPDPSEEITKYAEEKGVKLRYVPIANEALVFFTDKNNKTDNVTTEQIKKIYVENAVGNWSDLGGDDTEMAAYCRNNDSGSHAQMEKFILDGADINEGISRERTSYIMASILTDVDEYNKTHSDSIAMGYSLYYYYNTAQSVLGPVDLKLLSIDGINPSDESIGSGAYPYTTNYYAVVREEENPKVDKFIELMQSEFGNGIIRRSGLGVITSK